MTDVLIRGKKLADSVAIYGRGRELFRPPTYTATWNVLYEAGILRWFIPTVFEV